MPAPGGGRPQPRRLGRRPGPRRREEIEAERRGLVEDTWREIDLLLAEAHALLPRDRASSVAAVYARYSSRFQHSVADQVRACLEAAARDGAFVPRALVFFDLAVRGAKERRPGLMGLQQALAGGAARSVYVLTTNRLFRKTYKSMKFVEEEIYDRGLRCVFVKSGIDTAAPGQQWRLPLQLSAMTDELQVGMYAENIRVAQEGLFLKGLVCGTLPFGYAGRDVDGPPTRRGRPRQAAAVDPETAAWVVRAFEWFADGGASINEVVRRLNAQGAPLPPRAQSGRWTRLAVTTLLGNASYRGRWDYGATVTVWQNRADYARQVPRDKPLREMQFEGLRIVDEGLWHRAQRRLAARRPESGRPPKAGPRAAKPRLLNGLLECPAHGRRLVAGGGDSRFYVCPDCQSLPAADRPLFAQLPRGLALRLTCRALAAAVRADAGLAALVVAACRAAAAAAGDGDPAGAAALRARLERVTGQVQFVLDNAGESESDRRESQQALRRLRAERAELAAALAQAEAPRRPAAVPTEAEAGGLLDRLGDVLEAAAAGGPGADADAARAAVEALTGGRIALEQCGERRAKRGWLRGRARLRLVAHAAEALTGSAAGGEGPELVIDYREPAGPERLAERVKELHDRGLGMVAIGAELGVNRNLARKALVFWHRQRGLEPPDGRAAPRPLTPPPEPPYRRMADDVKALLDEGLYLKEAAARLGLGRATAEAAARHWYASRGLPVPDWRARRGALRRPRGRRTRPGSGPEGDPEAPGASG